jgi:hypothetical protein
MTTTIFRSKNKKLVEGAIAILAEEKPMTLRQLYYRCISAGLIENSQREYQRLGKVMTRLREGGEVPRTWIVDHVRSTLKPSSWSGLADFADTVRDAYRKDFWNSLNHHVEVFVEKDAIAGTIQQVTTEYDVALRVCRGYASVSFAGEIAETWSRITKPIFAYYLGDFDPSGFDIERDLRQKLSRYSGGCSFYWTRLAVRSDDFDDFDLIRLPVKKRDPRARSFVCEHGDYGAEVDAISPNELRHRVQQAILSHVDMSRWQKLQEVERLEQESVARIATAWADSV